MTKFSIKELFSKKVVDEEKLIDFIYEEWNGIFDKETIEKVLNSEMEYLRTLGIVK